MVFESYGLEKYYESFNESVTYVLKPNKYRPPKSNEVNVGAKMHTDKNLFSILSQNQMNGLEVQIKDDEWMAVEFPPSSFFLMATDVFMVRSIIVYFTHGHCKLRQTTCVVTKVRAPSMGRFWAFSTPKRHLIMFLY
ncbi:putative oxoglutarate/iron-dependent dioxygenase, isopenicillin N synthase [Helianthus annuus]|nr:putative oxoglutarate/iron-dependent dioxygenase, isopenicillin N synthase [Helianthus annuus]KAJ0483377.1 putative oxoglutarate/iron-dependent dioxygenase, isopenicillin N synthase [Helianthus annuus]KAJ0499438.1 putative oxoglutarate/iron-dependent dioxygenase, isopenicillin N synthase [Helianthus annuus]KAJ0665458.1 putative oxoglutarate/iron-dependent dioxygenase, isopenicillin N synthase [Helianthus annuus]KAJ0672893.1 putative oxoglutarate/iron-dependent dioxygenase, isopenicillin N sy